jgi:hypothetical protein
VEGSFWEEALNLSSDRLLDDDDDDNSAAADDDDDECVSQSIIKPQI